MWLRWKKKVFGWPATALLTSRPSDVLTDTEYKAYAVGTRTYSSEPNL